MAMSRKKKKYAKRIAAAAGSLAGLALAPAAADAGVVVVTGSPVSLAMSTPSKGVTWDVDGDGSMEFRLWNLRSGTYTTYYGGTYTYVRTGTIFLASQTTYGGQGNGRGMVAPFPTDNVLALRESTTVGPSNYFGRGGTYGSASNGYYNYRNAMGGYATGSYYIGYDFNYGFAPGENFVGFAFEDVDGLHYGFAVINFDVINGVVTIDRWAYESDADTPIHVRAIGNVVPEPSSLALLATGAAGLLAYRARRRAKAKAAPAVDTDVA